MYNQKLVITVGATIAKSGEYIPIQEQKVLRDKAVRYLAELLGTEVVVSEGHIFRIAKGSTSAETMVSFTVHLKTACVHYGALAEEVGEIYMQKYVLVEVTGADGAMFAERYSI